ncbi:kinase-like domain-containing protein [Chytriomyces sp. MP71]|nr:kinase-like domain-containing protein [Chytriomyces sp. MP71]
MADHPPPRPTLPAEQPTQPATQPTQTQARMRAPRDFAFGRVLGEGSYASVVLATEKETSRRFAIKVLDKKFIVRENKAKYAMIEKEVLNKCNHVYIVKLFYTFQSVDSLYFVIEYCENGDLLRLLRERVFTHHAAAFYMAEILLGVQYLHSVAGVLHRDLKPENILLTMDRHIKICDFGSAKILGAPAAPPHTTASSTATQTNSFVGTAEYCSPELLNDRTASPASDVWALACILFYMHAKRPPFKGANEYQTFQRILALRYEFPPATDVAWEPARALMQRGLVLDPAARVTVDEMKQDTFFEAIAGGPDGWEHVSGMQAPLLERVPIGERPVFTGDDLAEWYGRSMNVQDDDLVRGMVAAPEVGFRGVSEDSADEDVLHYPYETAEAIDDSHASSLSLSVDEVPVLLQVDATREREDALSTQRGSVLAGMLGDDELVVMVGMVGRRKGLMMRKLGLMLTDRPRLQFFDPEKYAADKAIDWSTIIAVESKDTKNFVIRTASKAYNLKDFEQHADKWVSAIRTLRDSCPDS